MCTIEQRDKILKALRNPNFTWRTVWGISDETGIPPRDVYKILNDSNKGSGEIAWAAIQSSNTDDEGNLLWTHILHYRKFTSTWKQIIDSIVGCYYA